MNFSVRQLTGDDWPVFSRIRLKALQTDPQVFGSNYEKESRFTESDWRIWLDAADTAIFMVFEADRPIGITGVGITRDDPTRQTAYLWGSWLEPEFRGQGLSRLMYRARLKWAAGQPGVKKLIVSHRASNVASKYANQKHGFVFTHTRKRAWSDGSVEDEVYYELKLSD